MQRCGKNISAAVNQRAKIGKVFSARFAPRLYDEDLKQLRDRTGSCCSNELGEMDSEATEESNDKRGN
jgi:hypothetical protein